MRSQTSLSLDKKRRRRGSETSRQSRVRHGRAECIIASLLIWTSNRLVPACPAHRCFYTQRFTYNSVKQGGGQRSWLP